MGPSGYAKAARGYFEILKNVSNISLKLINLPWETPIGGLNENDILSRCITKDELAQFIADDFVVLYFCEAGNHYLDNAKKATGIDIRKLILDSKASYGIMAWEPDKIPDKWEKFYNDMFTGVITPSAYCKHVFDDQLSIPVYNIPYIITDVSESKQTYTNNFNILAFSQWTNRKGFDILIPAFYSEFFNDENVSLTIKTYGNINNDNDKKEITSSLTHFKNSCRQYGKLPKCKVKLLYGVVSREVLNGLYDSVDVLATTTRGEAFGLTISEAISRGKRVIVPDVGGHLDYIHDSNYFINSRMETLRCSYLSRNYSSTMKLIESDFEDTRRILRKAYNDYIHNPEDWECNRLKSVDYTKKYLDNKNTLKKLIKVIEK